VTRGKLISLTKRGLYCKQGDFYVDPWLPVDRAVVTHGHADHAYRGSKNYLVTKEGESIARIRLDPESNIETQPYGATTQINGVSVSFHPAGHILGSAQVRIESKGEIWIVSGDYKLTPDATCAAFESIKCHYFITEATFGLPIYRWTPTEQVFGDISNWWRGNATQGKASVIFAYSLGKAQRVLNGVDRSIGTIYTHGSVERLTQAYREAGIDLPATTYVGGVENKKEFAGGLIVAPPSAQMSTWMKRFGPQSTGSASGWMMVRGARRQRAVDRGFVLSDHADWPELLTAIKATEAEMVYVTHGFSEEVVKYLNEIGIPAKPLKTQFVGDDLEGAVEMGDEEGESH